MRNEIQDKALHCLLSLPSSAPIRAGLGISMGVGKTLICLKFIEHKLHENLFTKVLVVAPKRSIFQSWVDEMHKHNLEHLESYIEFVTYVSLPKKAINNYSIVILDECHNLLYRHNDVLKSFTGDIIGVTGTPPVKKTSEKGEMVANYCPMVFNYTTDMAVDTGILNNYAIFVHLIPLSREKTLYKRTKNGGYNTPEEQDYNYWCNAIDASKNGKEEKFRRILRMKALMGYPSKEKYAKDLFNFIQDKVILFANTKEQASKLCQHSYYSGNKNSEENLEKFKLGEITKLSCVLQLNEGVNIPDLKQGIIMHAYGNERKSSQRLGRMLRLKPEEEGKIHILCYDNTIDVEWVKTALNSFDSNKIKWVCKKS